jgi:hypothetical protein
VVQQGAAPQASTTSQRSSVQRLCPECQEEARKHKLSPKLSVSEPQDPEELEAEAAAKQVTKVLEGEPGGTVTQPVAQGAPVGREFEALAMGLQRARADRNTGAVDVLERAVEVAAARPDIAREKIARDDGGGRSTWECIKWNLASAGVAGWTITIIGAVCGAVGAVIGLGGGPAAPGTVPSGAAVAAAVCLAGVAGLSVGFVLGIITGCLQDSSFQNITTPSAAAEGSPEGEPEGVA